MSLWYSTRPTHGEEKVVRQMRHVPTTDVRAYSFVSANEDTHDVCEVYSKHADVGEGSVDAKDAELLDEHRYCIDHLLKVAYVYCDDVKTLCALVVWSSGDWSWEPIDRFAQQEDAYRLWLIAEIGKRPNSKARRDALKQLNPICRECGYHFAPRSPHRECGSVVSVTSPRSGGYESP